MIVRIQGILSEVREGAVTVDRDGLSWEVLVPQFAVAALAAGRGREVTLHTLEFFEGNPSSGNLVPRMLGFLSAEDREFFTRFLGVKGIGPRKALKALTEPVRKIASWIEDGDTKALAQLPGIGKRAAEMIVASLKGKMDDLAWPEGEPRADRFSRLTDTQRDALEIMVSLGDTRTEAERWLDRAAQLHPGLESADDWIRACYRVRTGVEA